MMTMNSKHYFCGVLKSDPQLCPVFIKLSSENIVRLKFLLESYEGLGLMRTLNPDRGEIVILATSTTAKYLTGLLDSVGEELDLAAFYPPAQLLEGEGELV